MSRTAKILDPADIERKVRWLFSTVENQIHYEWTEQHRSGIPAEFAAVAYLIPAIRQKFDTREMRMPNHVALWFATQLAEDDSI